MVWGIESEQIWLVGADYEHQIQWSLVGWIGMKFKTKPIQTKANEKHCTIRCFTFIGTMHMSV